MRTAFRSIIGALLFSVFLVSACSPENARKPGATRFPSPEASRIPAQGTPDPDPDAEVVGINDGDTITVRMLEGGKQEKVRLATIDAPELNQPFGQAAKKSLSDLAFGKKVKMAEIERDRYGRIIAEVYAGGLNVNAEQIRRGFAWHYKEFERQQTAEMRAAYSSAEEAARQGRLGLWREQNPVPPWVWRR